MERWYKLNLGLGLMGIMIFGICILLFKKLPLLIIPAMFGLGIALKCIKNVYKGAPLAIEKKKRPDYSKKKKK